jgi:hypothetical protein
MYVLTALFGRFGFRKTAVGLTPFVQFYSTTFLWLLERFAFLYRNHKNVAYNRTLCASLQDVAKKCIK